VYLKKVYFINMTRAFRRLPTTSEVYRLIFEGVSRRRRSMFSVKQNVDFHISFIDGSLSVYLVFKKLLPFLICVKHGTVSVATLRWMLERRAEQLWEYPVCNEANS
jgi:hypothetical protein